MTDDTGAHIPKDRGGYELASKARGGPAAAAPRVSPSGRPGFAGTPPTGHRHPSPLVRSRPRFP